MYKILIADDEEKIRALIEKYAHFEGHEVAMARDGMEAVSLCRTQQFDAIILDVMMPELDGFSACREIRKYSDAPILFLSARSEEYDKIHGFEIGADDYVVKPFSPKELMMRVGVIMARGRREGHAVPHEIFTERGLRIDFTGRTVTIDGGKVNLSPKEYELLFFLVRNRGIALTRGKLLGSIWGYDFYGDDRTLDTHIKLLRRSLGAYASQIVTLRGVGYRFESASAAP